MSTLQIFSSILEAKNIPFTKTDSSICAIIEGVSDTGHKFSAKLAIEETGGNFTACCFGGFGADLLGVEPEKAIEEYCTRRIQILVCDGD